MPTTLYEVICPPIADKLIERIAHYSPHDIAYDDLQYNRAVTNIGLLICGACVQFTPELIESIATRRAPHYLRELYHYKLLRKTLDEMAQKEFAQEAP